MLEFQLFHAEVAELADALRSGRSPLTRVWVRLPPSAHMTQVANLGFCFWGLGVVCCEYIHYIVSQNSIGELKLWRMNLGVLNANARANFQVYK